MNISNSQKQKLSSFNSSKSNSHTSINVQEKKHKNKNQANEEEIQLEKSLKKSSNEQINIFKKMNSNHQSDPQLQIEMQKNKFSENQNEQKDQDQHVEIDMDNQNFKDEIKVVEEEMNEKNLIAKFYERENDSNNDKIYIYFLVFMFNIVMILFISNQYNKNNLNRYLIAQIFFIILERIAKFILFSTLEIPQLIIWNAVFLDYFAIINYESQRKLKRNYNLYNVIVKRIDIIAASKLIESAILSGPSLLLVMSAMVQDDVSSIYILSAISSLSNLILANKELMEFQILQCKFNSLTDSLRNRFFQSYSNHIKDLTSILINIGTQAGLWMVCTQIDHFILLHAFLTFTYIAFITLTCVYKSFQREKKLALQEKSQVDIRSVTAMVGLGLSFIIFLLFYCVFFFLKLKKVLYNYLIENSLEQQKIFTAYIEYLEKSSENIKQMKSPSENLTFVDYKFYQFSLAFKSLAWFRAYSICNTIVLLAIDIKFNIQNGEFMLVRIIAYVCSIIIFFHMFLMKRDYYLYKQIKTEKYLAIKLMRILKKSKITYDVLKELKEEDKILGPNILSHNASIQNNMAANEIKKEEDVQIPEEFQQQNNKQQEDDNNDQLEILIAQPPKMPQMKYSIFNQQSKNNDEEDDFQL